MRISLAIVGLCVLSPLVSGCTETARQRIKEREMNYCKSIGAGEGPALAQCMLTLRQQNAVAAAQNQAVYNQMIYQSAPRVQTTTCQQWTTGLTCQTF